MMAPKKIKASKSKASKPKAKKATKKKKLSERKCVPCDGGIPPLEPDEIKDFLQELSKGWKAVKNHHLFRRYEFADFAEAWEFVNFIGEIAEDEGHHPDIKFSWGYAEITIFTHAIDGLSESDFILAAKIDEIG
jgi:4a-hydroxytetrahydrobiopterin dehydratase